MKNSAIISFFLLVLVLCSTPTYAEEMQFVKYENNPLSITFNNGTEHENYTFHPFILYDNQQWKLWYSAKENGRGVIGYATSPDAIHWEKSARIDFPQYDGINNPSILKKDGLYYLYFSAQMPNRPFGGIYRAVSQDGIHYDAQAPNLVYGSQQNWENGQISSPFVWFHHNEYYLWYSGNYYGNWSLGMALSEDGISFTPCSSNPQAFTVDGPHVVEQDSASYLFYHFSSAAGIGYTPMPDHIDCDTKLDYPGPFITRGGSFAYDEDHIAAPSVAVVNNNFYVLYNTLGGGSWHLALATSRPLPPPTPTPTPRIPVVFIPGMFASWNKDAMVYHRSVSLTDWYILPFATEMDGLKETFQSLGYRENENFFIRYYDWRQNVEKTVDQLHNYIETIFPSDEGKRFYLVGHSLGGIIARIYAQKYGTDRIAKVITIGSPHKGTPFVYQPLSAGVIDRPHDAEWLGLHLALQLYRNGIETDKDIIHREIPSLTDISPTEPYLADQNNQFTDMQSMHIANQLLQKYAVSFPSIFSKLITIAGTGKYTVSGYHISPPSIIDTTLGLYEDGKPLEPILGDGDGTITVQSAQAGSSINLPLGHTELIFKKNGIGALLNALSIAYQNTDIIEGTASDFSHAYLLLVQSPATIAVHQNGVQYDEHEGLVYIPNPNSEQYLLTATGTDFGPYTILVGKITDNGISWNTIKGEITQDPPHSQSDTYPLLFPEPSATPSHIIPTIQSTQSPTPTDRPISISMVTNPTATPIPIPTPTQMSLVLLQTIVPSPKDHDGTILGTTDTKNSSMPQNNNYSVPGKDVFKIRTYTPFLILSIFIIFGSVILTGIFYRKEIGKWLIRIIKK